MNRLSILAALVLASSLPALAQAPEADLRLRLETEVPRLMREGSIPGLSIAVLRDGRIFWTGAMGVANPSGGARVTADTVFQAASLSKPVFSYVVLRLVDRGVIDLDRPLAAYLPHPRLQDERSRRITARMVLSHTTGLPNWDFGDGPIPLRFSPGESWGYSGEAFVYLQKVLETLTGMPLDDLARREVFEPLGMSRSSYVWKPAFEADAAAGVDESGAVQPTDRGQKANAAASLLTTAGDYARFLVAVLEGRGLEPETRKAWLDPQSQVVSVYDDAGSPRQPGVFWGLGWGLEQPEGPKGPKGPKEDTVFWHWGHQDAWRAYVAVRRDGKAGLVFFANTHEGLTIARALSDLAVGGPRPGLAWLKYESYDDPKRVARKDVERALAEGGAEAGVRRYRELRAKSPGVTDPAWVQSLADGLMERNRAAEAAVLLRAAVADEPRSAALHAGLGQALTATGELAPALAEYETAAQLDPGRTWPLMRKWLREGIDAKPVVLPEETLKRLAGSYGPRRITLEGGSLHYQREGRPKYRLIALGGGLFAVEGNGTFRVRFAEGGGRLAVLQPEGEDESVRTPGR